MTLHPLRQNRARAALLLTLVYSRCALALCAGKTCWGAVQFATINGGPGKAVSYANNVNNGQLQVTMKLSNLNIPNPTAGNHTKLCFKLRDGSVCSKASQLCDASGTPGGLPAPACRYAIFNNRQDCCPTAFANLNSSPLI